MTTTARRARESLTTTRQRLLVFIVPAARMATIGRVTRAWGTRSTHGRVHARRRVVSTSSRVERARRTRVESHDDDDGDDDTVDAFDDAGRGRRAVLLAGIVAVVSSSPSLDVDAAPPVIGLYEDPSRVEVGAAKTRVDADALLETLTRDVAVRRYFVTGDLTEEIFANDCRFIDPTTNVVGLSRYLRALRALFDPARSDVALVGELRRTSPNTIEGDYRAEGYLKLPWNPRVPPYEGHIVWTIHPDDGSERAGLIVEQRQTWNISGAEALRETFTPS